MANGSKNDPATELPPAVRSSARLPAKVVPWLTTGCLIAALIFQTLGAVMGQALHRSGDALPAFGIVLALLGLGLSAAVKGRSLAWAMLGIFPIVGPIIGYFVLRRGVLRADAALIAVRGASHFVLFLTLLGASLAWQGQGKMRAVVGDMPDDFPLLAIIRADSGSGFSAFVVQKKSFTRFAQEHPEFTYTVPAGMEQTLNDNLRYYGASGEFKLMRIDPRGYFKVTSLSNGWQRFEVRYPIHTEAHITGWYDASATRVDPRGYRFWHEMMGGVTGMFAILFTLALYIPIVWTLNRFFWRRWQTEE